MSLNLEQMKLSGFEPNPDLKWEKLGDMPPPDRFPEGIEYNCDGFPVAIDSHRVLVVDHAYGNIHESFVRLFDTRTREWSNEEWPSLNQPRKQFCCVVCNGKVYVIGGMNTEGEYLDSIECLYLSASPRQWITSDQTLATARGYCQCVAIGTQVFILGGHSDEEDKLLSVEILNTETGQLMLGRDLPQYRNMTATTVNNKLLVFAKRIEGDRDIGEIHVLETGQPHSTWETTASTLPTVRFVYEPIVIGDCVLLTSTSVHDTKRACCWKLPSSLLHSSFRWTLVGKNDIVAFKKEGIYSLKMKLDVQPPTATVLRHTKTMWGSMLFSPKYSDVTFVCPGGIEIPAHRNVLGAKSLYFDTYFSGPWTEQHPDGRWETNKSSGCNQGGVVPDLHRRSRRSTSLMHICLNSWRLCTNLSLLTTFFASVKQCVWRISLFLT